jgi:signal transduction histidine kinase
MDKMNEQDNKVIQLEYQLFTLACIISASAALTIALLDLFITGHRISLFLDLFGFVVFSTFYYLSKNEKIYPKLVIPFVGILYVLINLSWLFQGGGFNFSDAIIFFLIFITSLLIIPGKYRSYLIIFTAINVFTLIIIENVNNDFRYQYNDLSMEIFISDIFVILLFSIGGYLILNFKIKYESLSIQLLKAYDQIKESNKDLEHMIQERTIELKKVNKELDRLFYRSSHDFRRPLTTLMGINEVARLMKLEDKTMELFVLMNRTVDSMDKMLKKFYNLYEISHYIEEETPVSLSGMVERYEAQLHEKGHIIKTVVNLKKYNDMDPKNSLIDIILTNMIENAVAFTEQKNAEISLKITDNGKELNIQLEDKGIGIEDVFYDRIFDMYFRLSELSQGNGLGLYVVKTALGKLHGDISVKSEKNRYTLFEINIPF